MTPTPPLAALIALLLVPCFSHAQGFIERVDPPVAQRGKTTRVAFHGTQLARATDVWSSLPASTLKATPVGASDAAKAVFDLAIADNTPVGICGLRVATANGLSNTHLFLIDDLPPVAATASPMKVALPAAVHGVFRAAEVDRFTIDVAAGQKVSFEAVGSRLGKDVDPLITIRDARGKWLAERDNDPGLCFDCRFEHGFPIAGTYTVELRDARHAGAEHGSYVLRMGRFPAARVAVPSAVKPGQRAELTLPEVEGKPVPFDVPADQLFGPFVASLKRAGDDGSTWIPLTATSADVTTAQQPCRTLEQATPAKVPGMLCGVLRERGIRDYFRFELAKGQRIKVRAEARVLHSPADLEVALLDAKGNEVRRASDPGRDDFLFDFTANAAGSFALTVRDLHRDGGPAVAYRLDLRDGAAQFTVDADVEGLAIPRGNYQSFPVKLTNGARFGPIKLRLVGAPAGLTLTPDEIADTDTTVLCKLAAGADTPEGLHTVCIVAEPMKAEVGVVSTFVNTLPLIDRKRVNVDLIPYALREDQRRLPTSLTDHFAVQVTPAAAFSVDLPETLVTLGRYQRADFPLVTTRVAGFEGPITFTARGGQLADKDDVRTRVCAEFTSATSEKPQAIGSIHSRILSNLGKTRIDVEGTAIHQGRRVTLMRSFDLDLRPAFKITAEADKMVLPGSIAKVRLLADRVKTFDGAVTVQLSPVQGLELPATVTIPAGKSGVDLDVQIPADWTPRRVGLRARSVAAVGDYEEEQQSQLVELDVRKPEVPKK